MRTVQGQLADDRYAGRSQTRSAPGRRQVQVADRRLKDGAPVRLSDVATVVDSIEEFAPAVSRTARRRSCRRVPAARANIIKTVDACVDLVPQLRASIPPRSTSTSCSTAPRPSAPRSATSKSLSCSRCARDRRRVPVPARPAHDADPGSVVPISITGTFGRDVTCSGSASTNLR